MNIDHEGSIPFQGNTAMHYAVSHGNFDVVSILLDSKVCDVNQMNNAGYTSVMLVSLAKLKQPSHRTVVERLFKMADVNIRAKKVGKGPQRPLILTPVIADPRLLPY